MRDYLTHEEVEESMPLFRDKMLPWLIKNYDRMVPEDRYRATLDVYTSLEFTYNFPKKLLIGLKKIRPVDYLDALPDELKNTDPIIVYRGTCPSEFLSTVRTATSWTIDKNVAIWFSQRFGVLQGNMPGKLFSATIEKSKIIAYLGDRESEVVQHCGVEDIKEVPITQDEIDAAIETHCEQLSKNKFS